MVDQFFADILNSSWMTELSQTFSVPGYTIGTGAFLGTSGLLIEAPVNPPLLDANVIQTALQSTVENQLLPTSLSDTCYFVMVPPDVVVRYKDLRSDVNLGGYHHSVPTKNGTLLYYCVIPVYLPSDSDDLTQRISHELAEQITDPVTGTGWIGPPCNPNPRPDDPQCEVCDYCERGQPATIHGYSVSRFVMESSDSKPYRCGPGSDNVQPSVVDATHISFDKSLTRTSCVFGSIIEGQSLFLEAAASHRSQPSIIETITWQALDELNQPLTATNDPHGRTYDVIVPFGTKSVKVSADITTDLGCSLHAQQVFKVVTQDEADAEEKLCELIRRMVALGHIYKIPPLVPPPIWYLERDFTIYPLTHTELNHMARSARALGNFVREAEPLLHEFVREVRPFVPPDNVETPE